MKGIIYARYSSDSQREESIEGQLRECKAFAEKNDITLLATYVDRALSAKTDNRPDFQRMVKDSAKGLFDVVIVWKLDRFARNRYDSAQYKNTLKKNGVRVISATEQIAEDSTGILIESILEGYAEYYSAELSEKVIRGLTENAFKCKYNGGGIPVGYTIDEEQHFQIDHSKAMIVHAAFQSYANDATIKGLVDWFDEQGILTNRSKPLGIDAVKRLLKNRRYIGEYRYRDIMVEDGIPSIIEKPLFEKVQERLKKNKKAPARFKAAEEQYILTTKLFCGHCGAFMVGESGTGRNGIHQYYKCVSVKKHKGCKKKSVRKNWIEDIIVNETVDMLHDDAIFNYIIDIKP